MNMMTARLLMEDPSRSTNYENAVILPSNVENTDVSCDTKAFERCVPFLVENRDRICLLAGFSSIRVPLPVYGIKGRITLGALARLWKNPQSGFVFKCDCGADAYVYSCSVDSFADIVRNSVYCPTCHKSYVISEVLL